MNKFDKLIQEIHEEAKAEGPAAVAQLEGLQQHFRRANQLIALRKLNNVTQEKLAELSGIDQAEISRLERGMGNPTEATLTALAKPLGAEIRFEPIDTSSAIV